MSFLPNEITPYLTYATPPLVGAFIGYLTNRVAIKMLFRPLKPWKLFGMRVPMTPGVIPSKRHQLADNMGEVVGDHLLTSKEIGKALSEEKFQQHLLNVIAERVGAILHKDLPSIPELVPAKFSFYLNFGLMALRNQLKGKIHGFIQQDEFEEKIEAAIDDKLDRFLERELRDVVGGKEREKLFEFTEDSLEKMLASPVMEEWLNEFIRHHVYQALSQEKSVKEVLPESIIELIAESIREQTPALLTKLAEILKDPEVRNSIVRGTCGGVENFIESLGPMAPMVQNFITMEMVDEKIREYLDEKEDDIVAWLSSDDFKERVSEILSNRFEQFCSTPLVKWVQSEDSEKVEDLCSFVAKQLSTVLKGREVATALSSMIKDNIETHLNEGHIQLETVLHDLVGVDGVNSGRKWIKKQSVELLRSPDTIHTIDSMVDSLIDTVVNKKIGKLSNIIPADVRKEIYVAIQGMASKMLEDEVPGLVQSLDIRSIIAQKINSLDLLKLEKLLLSIMEEQFKYINLFGALLGFLIGCCNVFLLSFG